MGYVDGFHQECEPARGRFHEVAPGVRRMVADNRSLVTYHGTNSYLIETPDGLFVLDPGPAEDERHFAAIVEAIGRRGAGILISHHHSDHFGAVPRLQRQTGLQTYSFSGFADDTFRPDVPLNDGDCVAGLTAVHTPGHSSDHLCFRRDDGALFTGDHVMTWNSSIVMRPDGDMAAYCFNLQRLIDEGGSLFLPGHGPPLHDPIPYARNLLSRRLAREHAILQEVSVAAATVQDLAEKLYRKSEARLAWAAERNVETHLDKLRQEGRVVQEGDYWRAA